VADTENVTWELRYAVLGLTPNEEIKIPPLAEVTEMVAAAEVQSDFESVTFATTV
jgi:hypothetical protein